VSPDVLAKSQKSIGVNLGRVAKKLYKDNPQEGEKFVTASMARIKTATDPAEGAKAADLVVEAIVENIDIKHKLFKQLDAVSRSVLNLFCCKIFFHFSLYGLFKQTNVNCTFYCIGGWVVERVSSLPRRSGTF
jgi:hypothetical protein